MKKLFIAFVTSLLLAGPMQVTAQDADTDTPIVPDNGMYGQRGYPPRHSDAYRQRRGIRIERGINEEGYYLNIFTGEAGPESVQVEIQGRNILLQRSRSTQTEKRDDHGAYSFSRRSSGFRRRISLPRDADPEQMRRTESEGVITIILPRHTDLIPEPQGYGYGPGYRD